MKAKSLLDLQYPPKVRDGRGPTITTWRVRMLGFVLGWWLAGWLVHGWRALS